MLQYLYDHNIIIYTFAVLGGVGLVLRIIVNLVYKHLVRESDRLGETKNKLLRHMKMKFATCYKLKIGVNNVDTFVDKSVSRYRFCGVLLSTWDNLCGQDRILLSGAVGILASAVLIFVDKSINLIGKKKQLHLNLLDYLDNFCKVRLEQEAMHPELVEQYRREYFQTLESSKAGTAATLELSKDDTKKELSRRKEARQKKEEEKRLMAAKREEEQKKAEEARREAERRKQEERHLQAAKRREEERIKLEEERQALEAKREELRKKTEEKQLMLEKKKKTEEREEILNGLDEELQTSREHVGMDKLMEGIQEIAEKKDQERKATLKAQKEKKLDVQEEKLIEDVLKEFFA